MFNYLHIHTYTHPHTRVGVQVRKGRQTGRLIVSAEEGSAGNLRFECGAQVCQPREKGVARNKIKCGSTCRAFTSTHVQILAHLLVHKYNSCPTGTLAAGVRGTRYSIYLLY
jgi:hypothetical protein